MSDPVPERSEPRPWPLKWIALLIVAYIVFQALYAWLNREPPPAATP